MARCPDDPRILPPRLACPRHAMRTAIVSAMHEELAAVLADMADPQSVTLAGREFHVGTLDGHQVVLVLSGIGKVAAATTVTTLALHFEVSRLLFTGVAGGLAEGVQVGDVVVADCLMQHDLDVSPIFPRYHVPSHGTDRFAPDAGWSEQLVQAAQAAIDTLPLALAPELLAGFGIQQPRLHQGLVVSGDRFVSTELESTALRAELPEALAVEMEGAAVAQVCHDFDLPFAVVRSISDRADDDAHVDFNAFLREVASRYTRQITRALLKGLNSGA